MDSVEHIGIPFKELTDKLLDDGVKQFAGAFAKLLKATYQVSITFFGDKLIKTLDKREKSPLIPIIKAPKVSTTNRHLSRLGSVSAVADWA